MTALWDIGDALKRTYKGSLSRSSWEKCGRIDLRAGETTTLKDNMKCNLKRGCREFL